MRGTPFLSIANAPELSEDAGKIGVRHIATQRRVVIESALSVVVAAVFGYWHVLYSRVIGLSVVTAVFFLATHKNLLPMASLRGDRGVSVSPIWAHVRITAIFMSISVCFLAVHFTVYFLVSWLH